MDIFFISFDNQFFETILVKKVGVEKKQKLKNEITQQIFLFI
jgi:hypothetical protein